MTIGVSKEYLESIINEEKYGGLLSKLISKCTELDPWIPIDENTPKDKDILVYAPAYQDLRPLKQVCRWHESAGFCIDELRTPTHYKLLPDDPK